MNAFPSYHDIAYFLEVAKIGNLTRAAERIGITQPSLSQAMKRLEGQMGVDLLIRRREGTELTEAGERLQRQGEVFLRQWEQMRANIQGDEHEVTGHFRLGCHPSVALYTLDKCLPHIYSRFPLINFEFVHDISRKVVSEIVSRDVDYGLVINPIPHPELVLKPLSKDRICLWVSQEARESAPDTLIFDPRLKQSQTIIQQLPETLNTFKRHLHSSQHEVIRSLVESGMGIGMIPEKVAKRSVKPLILWNEKAPQYQDQLFLAYRADRFRGPAHKAIVSALSSL